MEDFAMETSPRAAKLAFGAHRLVDRIGGTTSRVAHQLGKTATQLKDREQRLVAASSGYAHEHPFKLAGIAIAAGFLISHMVSWRKTPDSEE